MTPPPSTRTITWNDRRADAVRSSSPWAFRPMTCSAITTGWRCPPGVAATLSPTATPANTAAENPAERGRQRQVRPNSGGCPLAACSMCYRAVRKRTGVCLQPTTLEGGFDQTRLHLHPEGEVVSLAMQRGSSALRSWQTSNCSVQLKPPSRTCSTCTSVHACTRAPVSRTPALTPPHPTPPMKCVAWCGFVWCVRALVWCGAVWCGAVWCGVPWRGVVCGVWCGVAWGGAVWSGVLRRWRWRWT